MKLAQAIDAIAVVQSTADRAVKFPVPATDQRVWNNQTKAVERWDGAAWVKDLATTIENTTSDFDHALVSGGFRHTIDGWWQDNVPASQAATVLTRFGAGMAPIARALTHAGGSHTVEDINTAVDAGHPSQSRPPSGCRWSIQPDRSGFDADDAQSAVCGEPVGGLLLRRRDVARGGERHAMIVPAVVAVI